MIDTHNRGEAMDYESFLRDNRYKVNHSLNRILWICIIAGPAIALGVMGGVFKRTTYEACVIISVVMALVAGGNSLILRRTPYSYAPGMIALVAVDLLLGYMNISHISIRLTWYLVPFLSMLFCSRKVYIGISVLNYLVMALATWLEAPHYAVIRADFTSTLGGFINIFAGCTIEAIIMFAAGYALGKATISYYKNMIGQYAEAQAQKQTMQEQLDILDSMAEIYDNVNLIDFTEGTEMSLREETLQNIPIGPGQDHTRMTQEIRSRIAADMVDDFWMFTDITTLRERMAGHKSISGEFVSNRTGWFRTQFIRVSGNAAGEPDVVIHTFQNIDADKRREEHLIRISQTDELTRMYNRRCYEEDAAAIVLGEIPDDLALISADVNGLKAVNDSLGHAAGDELIRGAALCLFSVLGSCGKVYRTGGDEFIAIVRSRDCGKLLEDIRGKAAAWSGMLVKELAISLGYAARAEDQAADVDALEKLADKRMYEDKALYYQKAGHERRS